MNTNVNVINFETWYGIGLGAGYFTKLGIRNLGMGNGKTTGTMVRRNPTGRSRKLPRTTTTSIRTRGVGTVKRVTRTRTRTPKTWTGSPAALAKILAVVKGHPTFGIGEIATAVVLPKSLVARALAYLKGQGQVYLGGNRRFSRYGVTQAIANKAAITAKAAA